MRALAHQRSLFQAVPGRGALNFVPLDFTLPEDGFDPPDYGREALIEALIGAAPAAVRVALGGLPGALAAGSEPPAAHAHILGYAAAAGAFAPNTPWVAGVGYKPWQGHSRATQLASSAIAHNAMHLGEAVTIRSLAGFALGV